MMDSQKIAVELYIMAANNITLNSMEYQTTFRIWFWLMIATIAVICIVGMLGNGLVIYVANRKPKTGALCDLNKVVRNLAVTDFLMNVVGAPGIMLYWIICWLSLIHI